MPRSGVLPAVQGGGVPGGDHRRVEVESFGDELRLIKHKSERYKFELDHEYQALHNKPYITNCLLCINGVMLLRLVHGKAMMIWATLA